MKGDWIVSGGSVHLDSTPDTSADLAAIQAERDAQKARADKMTAQRDQARTELAAIAADRDAAQAKLTAVQTAHETLVQQMAKLEAAIQAAGLTITQAEPGGA